MTFEEFFGSERRRIEALYESARAARWQVTLEDFARAAWQGVSAGKPSDFPQLLSTLRAGDLALALACAQGAEAAWDTFCAEYRPVLYAAARVFIHEEAEARDLADSLLAELYGLDSTRPGRHSRFAYFHGRSSLKTWLRAVLYQRFVDEYRRQRRLEPLPEEAAQPAAAPASLSADDDRRYAECLSEALESALGELPARSRLLLGYYYVQSLTLKQIGRLTGEHEATVSRELQALRKLLRKRIEGHLRRVRKLSAFEIDRCLDFASRGVAVKLEKVLKPALRHEGTE
jgi:RNA polymerase sigma-70 factor